MWEVKNHTPFASLGYFVRDADGVEHWVVAMRATFDLARDQMPVIADVQSPIKLVPEMAADTPDEMREEADFQPFRPSADVVLHGTASRPDGVAFDELPVSLSVGKLSKTLLCSGPRHLTRGRFRAAVSAPDPVTAVPLSWQNALGGASLHNKGDAAPLHDANPLGMGWVENWADLPRGVDLPLPQITDPAAPISADKPFPQPQGFGPLQPHWGPRRHLAGTFDQDWEDTRHPRLPKDFSPAFHHSVLPDQTANLVGGESVSVVNASAAGPMQFRLPQMIITADTRIRHDRYDTRLRIVGVTIDAAQNTLSMIWNTAIPCNGRDTDVSGSSLRITQMSGVAA